MRSDFLSRLISKPSSGVAEGARERPSSPVSDDWGGLMVAAQGGHGGAYRRLLGEISVWLTRYFQRRLPPGDVDDAVQETLLAIHRRRHTYDPRYPLAPWLAAIAKRKWIDQLRSLGRRPNAALSENLSVDDHEASVISASVLASLLEELRPAQAQAILLVKVQGYSIEDASGETGLSPSAVKMNIHRGLARLTAFIEKTSDVA
uniref:sigma-70 family RNA polymerase sigma factor n=1 Tax=uncultured Sphingomonas sp. TaxID=158754 RepID=UPI0035CBBE9C